MAPILLIALGFLLFDLIPIWLDEKTGVKTEIGSSFFVIAIAVFLNVHHFFIDSFIWRRPKAEAPSQMAAPRAA